MKDYPSIPDAWDLYQDRPCVAFKKYDGSNLRSEWSPKRGWYKWGTRAGLFDASHPVFGPAIELFHNKYAEPLTKAIADGFKKPAGAVAFMEFLGPYSFAGLHDPKELTAVGVPCEHNDPKDVVLFDVNIHKRGFVGPEDFLRSFGHMPVAEAVYHGPMTKDFVSAVHADEYGSTEGVICKGGFGHNLWMLKIKKQSYKKLLQDRFGVGKWEKYL